MRMRRWIVSGAIVGVAAMVAAPVAQTANPKSSRRTVRTRVDPAAASDKSQAAKEPGPDTLRSRALSRGVALPQGIASRLALRNQTVAVMIQLSDAPAAVSYGLARSQALAGAAAGADTKQANKAAAAAGRTQLGVIERAQSSVLSSLSRLNARVLYRTQRAYNGIAAHVNLRDIPQIRRMPGVKAVRVLIPKKMDNWNSVPFIGATAAWTKGLGYTGAGIRVGVIDTGIDYLHSNFRGPGANADYLGLDPTVPNTWNVFTDTDDFFPSLKVAGGTDFAGDAYDASLGDPDDFPEESDTPVPDDNPMDCNGHGSHVAGTIGGYGVDPAGNTFNGPYGSNTPFASLKIGPGVAPEAKLYGLRVFGCDGSTNLVPEALDWAVDPDGDGDFSDHLDVVNMSLGSSFGGPDDPDAVASDNATLAGVIVVASAGNAGDTYFIAGSPANSARAISVAASEDKAAILGGLLVNSPASQCTGSSGATSNICPATEAVFGPDLADGDFTGNLAITTPLDGCTTISENLTGKIALIARGTCSFETKVANAQAKSAIAVVITNNVDGFPITLGSDDTVTDPTIPSMMIAKSDGDTIRATLASPATVNVTETADFREQIQSVQLPVEDRIASFSSRGPSRKGALKPDITSVGASVFSTQALSGFQGDSFNGTSMAAPHVAGTMALLRQVHPSWTVEELKALVMNNADHDVYLSIGLAVPEIGPGRIGAGREDVQDAVNNNVVAYNNDGSGRVSVSFGSVEVASNPTVVTRTVKVSNKGQTAVSYTLAYDGANMPDIPGVAITTSTGLVNVAAGASATFDVILTADPTAMKHTRDASVSRTQTAAGLGFTRHFLSEEAGYVTLTPASGPVLRMPVHAAARPVSAMGTTKTGINIGVGPVADTKTLTLTGTPVNTGSCFSTNTATCPTGQDERSLVSVFELQEVSPELVPGPGLDDSADIRYVGVAKSSGLDEFGFNGDVLNFGIATYGDWSTFNAYDTEFDVYIDIDNDLVEDFVLFNLDYGSIFGAGVHDSYISVLVDLNTEDTVFERRPNGLTPGTRDTVTSNNRVVNLSTYAIDIGVTGSFNYYVVAFNREEGFVDFSDLHTWDFSAPGLSAPGGPSPYGTNGAPMYEDLNSATIDVDYDRDAYNAQCTFCGSKGLLLLHHHNAAGTQAQVINVVSEPQVAGDFDASGKGDILWRNTSTGLNTIWFLDGTTVTSQAPITALDTSWQVGEVGDFDGDLDTDILWRRNTGENTIWLMNGSTVATTAPIATVGTAWTVAGSGDFDGDGRADILWRNTSSGLNTIWFLNGGTVASQGATTPEADTNWKVADVGDFDGNGKADILWRNTSTGQNKIWLMDGTAATPASIDTAAVAWTVAGVGDFNADGKGDILWRNTSTGLNTIWFMNGSVITTKTPTNAVTNVAWKAHVTDVSGDGKADIVWRNEVTGLNTIWLMDGATQTAAAPIQAVNTNWIIASPRP